MIHLQSVLRRTAVWYNASRGAGEHRAWDLEAPTPIIRPTDTVGGLDHKTKGIIGERNAVVTDGGSTWTQIT